MVSEYFHDEGSPKNIVVLAFVLAFRRIVQCRTCWLGTWLLWKYGHYIPQCKTCSDTWLVSKRKTMAWKELLICQPTIKSKRFHRATFITFDKTDKHSHWSNKSGHNFEPQWYSNRYSSFLAWVCYICNFTERRSVSSPISQGIYAVSSPYSSSQTSRSWVHSGSLPIKFLNFQKGFYSWIFVLCTPGTSIHKTGLSSQAEKYQAWLLKCYEPGRLKSLWAINRGIIVEWNWPPWASWESQWQSDDQGTESIHKNKGKIGHC